MGRSRTLEFSGTRTMVMMQSAIPPYHTTQSITHGRHHIYHHQRCSFKDSPKPQIYDRRDHLRTKPPTYHHHKHTVITRGRLRLGTLIRLQKPVGAQSFISPTPLPPCLKESKGNGHVSARNVMVTRKV